MVSEIENASYIASSAFMKGTIINLLLCTQVMARFANDCLTKSTLLLRKLEVKLDPDTSELGFRFGLRWSLERTTCPFSIVSSSWDIQKRFACLLQFPFLMKCLF